MPPLDLDFETISDIKWAVKDCRERHLLTASKWASELLLSIPASKRNAKPPQESPSSDTASSSAFPRHSAAPPLNRIPRTEDDAVFCDALQSASIYLRAREYPRVRNPIAPFLPHYPKALYLFLYSGYLAMQKDNTQEWELSEKTSQRPTSSNYTDKLNILLSHIIRPKDPWLLYLKALFLARLSRREESMENAILSIASYPWNWAAWTLLASLIGDGEELQAILSLLPLPHNHILVYMFQIKTVNDLHTPTDHERGLCEQLMDEDFFPDCVWLLSQRACVLYYQHNFGAAEAAFDQLLARDPYRIEDIDLFSNILYVTENSLKLSRLAHEVVTLEKDRPEICCLLGNHHSIRAEHEKAIKYFRRATQLDRSYLSAWTLMGHEYVEMKNPHAAVAAYRNAIGVNRRDYRAWYGLGQVYELLSMHNYALYYYQHATALRPYDTRLWQAEAACYKDIGKYRDAIECLKRALIPADEDQISIVLKLADLHQALGEMAESAAYHRRVVQMCTAANKPVDAFAFSCLQIADFEMRTPNGNLRVAEEYCYEVSRSNAEETTRAADMLRELDRIMKLRAEADRLAEEERNKNQEQQDASQQLQSEAPNQGQAPGVQDAEQKTEDTVVPNGEQTEPDLDNPERPIEQDKPLDDVEAGDVSMNSTSLDS